MSDKRIIATGGQKKRISVVLTEHALNRIERRFKVNDPEQIERVLEEAATNGIVASDSGDFLIEHGCLLVACEHDGNGALTAMTAYNLSEGLSRRMKERTRNVRPAPWDECEVEAGDGRSDHG